MTTIELKKEQQVAPVVKVKKKSRIGKLILQSGIIGWLFILLVWQIASMFSEPMFLPSPFLTLIGAIEIAGDGTLFLYMGFFTGAGRMDTRTLNCCTIWPAYRNEQVCAGTV